MHKRKSAWLVDFFFCVTPQESNHLPEDSQVVRFQSTQN